MRDFLARDGAIHDGRAIVVIVEDNVWIVNTRELLASRDGGDSANETSSKNECQGRQEGMNRAESNRHRSPGRTTTCGNEKEEEKERR